MQRLLVLAMALLLPLAEGKRMERSSVERYLHRKIQAKSQKALAELDVDVRLHRVSAVPMKTFAKLLGRSNSSPAAFHPSILQAPFMKEGAVSTRPSRTVMWQRLDTQKKGKNAGGKTDLKSGKGSARKGAKFHARPGAASGVKSGLNSGAKSRAKIKGKAAVRKFLDPAIEVDDKTIKKLSFGEKAFQKSKQTNRKLILDGREFFSKQKRKEAIALEMLKHDWEGPKKLRQKKKKKQVILEGQVPRSLLTTSGNLSVTGPQFTKFSELPTNKEVRRVLTDVYGFDSMTPVQAHSIGPALQGMDVLARSQTGSGKTFAFLIPAIERALRCPAQGANVTVLVLSPTRQLALQTADEARKLVQFLDPPLNIASLTGGERLNLQTEEVFEQLPDLLVTTPGRLLTHLKEESVFTDGVRVLVLDEADRLLDSDNLEFTKRILRQVPHHSVRQTLMFSATFADEIKAVASNFMRPDTAMLDMLDQELTAHIPQTLVVTSMQQQLAAVMHGVQEAQLAGGKVLVFLPTARQASLYAKVYNWLGELTAEDPESLDKKLECTELHTRMTQAHRHSISEAFRAATRGTVVFSSDMASRGMDYPDVTLIVQVGAPQTRETYTHRLGRTARAGKPGSGILYLADYESQLLESELLAGFPLVSQSTDALASLDTEFQANVVAALERVQKSGATVRLCKTVYQSWLAHHMVMKGYLGWSREHAVEMANKFAREALLLRKIPVIEEETAFKMGLKDVWGLNTGEPEKKHTKSKLGRGFG